EWLVVASHSVPKWPLNVESRLVRAAGDGTATGAIEGARQRVPDGPLGHSGCIDDGGEVEARNDARVLGPVDELLRGDVATGTGRERAAAQATDARVELPHPVEDRGECVGLAGSSRVVEVDADVESGRLGTHRVDQRDCALRGHRADRVAEAELVGAVLRRGADDVQR